MEKQQQQLLIAARAITAEQNRREAAAAASNFDNVLLECALLNSPRVPPPRSVTHLKSALYTDLNARHTAFDDLAPCCCYGVVSRKKSIAMDAIVVML